MRRARGVAKRRGQLVGHDLVGREINLKWIDGIRYDAVVVRYYARDNEYKIVYPADEGVEVTAIDDREWRIKPKRTVTGDTVELVGAIIEFVYPVDKKKYQAMVYKHSDGGEQLRVCYLDDHTTDIIGGNGWSFITNSPCTKVVDGASGSEAEHSDKDEQDNADDADYQVDDDSPTKPIYKSPTSLSRSMDSPIKQATLESHSPAKHELRVAPGAAINKRPRVPKRKPWLK